MVNLNPVSAGKIGSVAGAGISELFNMMKPKTDIEKAAIAAQAKPDTPEAKKFFQDVANGKYNSEIQKIVGGPIKSYVSAGVSAVSPQVKEEISKFETKPKSFLEQAGEAVSGAAQAVGSRVAETAKGVVEPVVGGALEAGESLLQAGGKLMEGKPVEAAGELYGATKEAIGSVASATPLGAALNVVAAQPEVKAITGGKDVSDIASLPLDISSDIAAAIGREVAMDIPRTVDFIADVVNAPIKYTTGKGLEDTPVDFRPFLEDFAQSVEDNQTLKDMATKALPENVSQAAGVIGAFMLPITKINNLKFLNNISKYGTPGKVGASVLESMLEGLAYASTRKEGERAEAFAYDTATDLGIKAALAALGGVGSIAGSLMPSAKKYIGDTTQEAVSKYYTKAVRPSIRGTKTATELAKKTKQANDAVQAIVENKNALKFVDDAGNINSGVLPENLNEFAQAVEQTKRSVFEQYDTLARAAGEKGITIKLDNVLDKIDEIISNKTTRPELVSALQKERAYIESLGELRPLEAQGVIKNYNASLQPFYQSGSAKLQAEVDASLASLIRQNLDNAIDNASGEYQALKKTYGSLSSIEKDVVNRAIIDARKANKGFFDLSDIFSGGDLAAGVITANPALLAKGTAQKGALELIKSLNDPNRAVKDMFQKIYKEYSKEIKESGLPRYMQDLLIGTREGAESLFKTAKTVTKKAPISEALVTLGMDKEKVSTIMQEYNISEEQLKSMTLEDFINMGSTNIEKPQKNQIIDIEQYLK